MIETSFSPLEEAFFSSVLMESRHPFMAEDGIVNHACARAERFTVIEIYKR